MSSLNVWLFCFFFNSEYNYNVEMTKRSNA